MKIGDHAWYGRGNALRKLERYEEAIESCDHALKIKPEFYLWWAIRGDIFLQLCRYEEAVESYDRALKVEPNLNILQSKGTVLYQLGRHQEASDCFSQIAEMQPTNKSAWNNQGYLLLSKYSYGLQPIFGKPLLIRPFQSYDSSSNNIGVDLECCRTTVNLFDIALKLDPDFTMAWANRSFPTYCLKLYESALQSCDKALGLDPENREYMNDVIYTNRGYILLQLHNPTFALKDFTAALKINSELDEAWIGHGTALYKLGRYSEALHSFTRALHLNHPLAQANLNLAQQHLPQNSNFED